MMNQPKEQKSATDLDQKKENSDNVKMEENMVLTFKTSLIPDFVEKLQNANKKLEKYNYQIKILKKEYNEKKGSHGITNRYVTITLDTPVFIKTIESKIEIEEYDEDGKTVISEIDNSYNIREGLKFSMEGFSYLGTLTRKAVGKAYEISAYSPSGRNIKQDLKDWDTCDHCGRNIWRKRYHLFIKDGTVVQVGSSCAKEYFGLDIMRLIQVWEKETEEFYGYDGSGSRGYWAWNPKEIMFYGFQLAGFHEGWDKSILYSRLNFFRHRNTESAILEFQKRNSTFLEEYKEQIEEAYERIYQDVLEFDQGRMNSFQQNLYDALYYTDGAKRDYTTNSGIIGWKAFDTFKKMIKEQSINEGEGQPEKNDEPIAVFTHKKCQHKDFFTKDYKTLCGKVMPIEAESCPKCGTIANELNTNPVPPRLTQKVKCIFKTMGQSDSVFSEYWYLIKFVNENNQEIVRFASKRSEYDLFEVDGEYTIKFSIKEHKKYNGHFSTTINRLVLIE